MQRRLGYNTTGYFGLLQAFADALKLLLKEYVGPAQATGYFPLSLQSHVCYLSSLTILIFTPELNGILRGLISSLNNDIAYNYFINGLKDLAGLNLKQKVSTVIPLLLSIVNFIVYAINDSAYLTGYFSDLFLASRISLYGGNFKDDYYNFLLDLYLNHCDLIVIETA
jgi:hypothetical protein